MSLCRWLTRLAALIVFLALAPPLRAQSLQGFADRKATVNGFRMNYMIGGDGPAVVLIHGHLTSWWEWHLVMPELAKTHTVIAVDTRGIGDSDKPVEGYDKATLASDIHELVKQLKFAQVDVVGHDLGVMVAYAFAANYRDVTRRLVVVDGVLPGVPPWDELIHRDRSWHFAFYKVPDVSEMLVSGHIRDYVAWFWNNQAVNAAALTPEDLDIFTHNFERPGALRASFNYYRAFDQDVAANAVLAKNKLTVPVLAVGAETGLGPLMEQVYGQVAQNVTVKLIPNTGHWIAEEQPQALLATIEPFIAADATPGNAASAAAPQGTVR